MTVERIAYLLDKKGRARHLAKLEIIPAEIWCEESEALLDEAIANVGKLHSQHNELDLLLPQFRYKHKLQFTEAVREVAGKLYEKLYKHE